MVERGTVAKCKWPTTKQTAKQQSGFQPEQERQPLPRHTCHGMSRNGVAKGISDHNITGTRKDGAHMVRRGAHAAKFHHNSEEDGAEDGAQKCARNKTLHHTLASTSAKPQTSAPTSVTTPPRHAKRRHAHAIHDPLQHLHAKKTNMFPPKSKNACPHARHAAHDNPQ